MPDYGLPPGLNGYRAALQDQAVRQHGDLQQLTSGVGILQALQRQQQEQAVRGLLSSDMPDDQKFSMLASGKAGLAGIAAAHQMAQVQDQQARLAQAQKERAFFSPENQAKFMVGGSPAQPAEVLPEDVAGPARPAQPAVPGQFDLGKFVTAGAAQGVVKPEVLLNHQMQQQARIDALNARLYDIQKRSEDKRLTLTQQADLARQADETKRYLGMLIASTKQAPAPTLATIQDPNDPTKNIVIDARTRSVVGNAPKDRPGVQDQAGRETVSELVTNLGDLYNQLNEKGAITNTKSGTLANAAASAATSGVGQSLGRIAGTENQSIRDKISSTRPLLLQAIRKATGMTSKAMDSNVELQLYLRSATDPSMGYQANKNALETLDKLYGLSGGAAKKEDPLGIR